MDVCGHIDGVVEQTYISSNRSLVSYDLVFALVSFVLYFMSWMKIKMTIFCYVQRLMRVHC